MHAFEQAQCGEQLEAVRIGAQRGIVHGRRGFGGGHGRHATCRVPGLAGHRATSLRSRVRSTVSVNALTEA